MKRTVTPELLDSDSGTPAEIAGTLADLRFINRSFGGIKTTHAMVDHIAQRLNSKSLSLLEVAAGSGDVPRAVKQRMHRRLQLSITMLDRARTQLNGDRAVVGD